MVRFAGGAGSASVIRSQCQLLVALLPELFKSDYDAVRLIRLTSRKLK
jgi:hypothetical protein